MGLKWKPFVGCDGPPVAVAMLVEFDGAESVQTDWELHCDRHWDTGAPDEWIASCAPKQISISFPTKAEATAYAEVTYALGASNEADVEGA